MKLTDVGWLLVGLVLIDSGCTSSETKVVEAREPNVSPGQGIREFEISKTAVDSWTHESSRRVENELDGWKPTCEEPYQPAEEFRSRTMSIVGTWRSRGGGNLDLDGSSLTIKEADHGAYTVSFSTWGCLDHWQLERKGNYSGGVLVLDRPIAEYFPLRYRQLYSMQIEGQDYLLPALCMEDMSPLLQHGETVEGSVGRTFLMFRRSAPIGEP